MTDTMSVLWSALIQRKIIVMPNNEKQRIKASGEKKHFPHIPEAVQLLKLQSQAKISTRTYKCNLCKSLHTTVDALHPNKSKMATSQARMLSSRSIVHRKQSRACYPPTYKILEVMNLNKASHFSWQTKKKIILTKLA